MKCPGCNKMASYEDPEVEDSQTEVEEGGNVQVTGRVILRSACCSEELKEWQFELEGSVNHKHAEGEDEPEFEVDCDDAEVSDYYSGKPGTPARYQKHMYKVTASPKVTCSCGGFEETLELEDEQQASGFDELV